MIEILCLILMVAIFGKILRFAIKMTWGMTKILVSVVFFPFILIGMILFGLSALVLPILILLGIILLIKAVVV